MDTSHSQAAATPGPTRSWPSALAATRHSLLSRLRSPDDADAWQGFFDTYASVIHGCARKAGLSEPEADEVLQDTLVTVAKEMPGFQYDPAKGSFKGWLFRIVRRRIADHFRRNARRSLEARDGSALLDELPDPSADPLHRLWEEEWRQNQLERAIDRVRGKVAARQWQMFDLATLKQWPTDRICETLGVNRAQIYMAKLRVGRALREEIRKVDSDAGDPSASARAGGRVPVPRTVAGEWRKAI